MPETNHDQIIINPDYRPARRHWVPKGVAILAVLFFTGLVLADPISHQEYPGSLLATDHADYAKHPPQGASDSDSAPAPDDHTEDDEEDDSDEPRSPIYSYDLMAASF